MDLLKFVTAGSVDDGKSTLIGRLLYDTQQLYEDQITAVEKSDRVEGELDFSLFTDGLSDEREQKITIDVAYRYFSTAKRRFIIADVPGHEQYTRNMVTGASKAEAALILIDARKGLLEQTKRHLYIMNLLRIPSIAVVINKMDMVDYDVSLFEKIKGETKTFVQDLNLTNITFIPASSLKGDMIVTRDNNIPWYEGPTVLEFLEKVSIYTNHNFSAVRFPIQTVSRPNQDFRGYTGTLISGSFGVGEQLLILPSREVATVKEIFVAGTPAQKAEPGEPLMITFEQNVDAGRGDLLVKESEPSPVLSHELETTIAWFFDEPLEVGKRYLLKQNTHTTPCFVQAVRGVVDVVTKQEKNSGRLNKNDIGRVFFQTQKPLCFDTYSEEKTMGSFILIDEITNSTAGAGVITARTTSEKKLESPKIAASPMQLWEKVELSKFIIKNAFKDYPKLFATCSFGKDSRVLVDLAMSVQKDILFYGIDTGYEFKETLVFADQLIRETHMNFAWIFAPQEERERIEAEYGDTLKKDNQYKCCAMKRPALTTILPRYEAWITGLRRDEAPTRTNMPVIETNEEITKINPLAFWTKEDIWNYIHEHHLSYHPLYNEGYTSLGCAPCTHKPKNGDERSGRFLGTFEEGAECGLHNRPEKE